MTLVIDMALEMKVQFWEEAAREGIEPEQCVLSTVQERLGRTGQMNSIRK